MSQMPESDGPSSSDEDRYSHWVAAWSDAVRAAPTAMGLVELPSTRFLALSPPASALLGRSPDEPGGFDALSVFELPDEVAVATRLVSEGSVDGVQSRRRLRPLERAAVEVTAHSRAIRSSIGLDLGLWVLTHPDASTGSSDGPSTELLVEAAPRPASRDVDGARLALGIVDDRWQVVDAEPAAGDMLDRLPDELVGTSIVELVHPNDVGAMLLAVAATTTEPRVLVCLRVRHRRGTWLAVNVVVTMSEADDGPRFELALTSSAASDRARYDRRVDQLEQHLRRISAEVAAAGVVGTFAGSVDLMGLPALRDLSARQWEVLTRLVRGERVHTIASEMHLSRSTVRNHLAAIYRKVGVHSQHELLATLRDAYEPSMSR
jgi:DNA-binding NarL/FixJ family response regulator